MSELKPCPFCGSTDVAANSYSIEASVRCFDCFAVIVRKHPKYSDGGLVAAITAWNTRATDALLREAMGAFENAMGHLDTPISRRKIGIDPNEEWLLDARASAFRRVNFQPHFLILSTDGRHSANCNGVTNNDARR